MLYHHHPSKKTSTLFFFFFNDPAPPEFSSLPLPDALPISLVFFGQTVNVAARLQHIAESGEVVLEAEGAQRLTPDLASKVRLSAPLEVTVKGVPYPLKEIGRAHV